MSDSNNKKSKTYILKIKSLFFIDYCFSNKSNTANWATLFLNENGIETVNLHGDMPYETRLGKFKKYQDGHVNVMVCTDVGSRGLNTIRVNNYLTFFFVCIISTFFNYNNFVFRLST